MNLFTLVLGVLALLVAWQQLGAGTGRWVRWLRVLLCLATLSLFLALLGSMQPVGPAGSGQEGAQFQRSGTLFVSFHGVQKPLGRGVSVGGGDSSDYLVERVPGQVAALDAQGRLRLSSASTRDDVYSATLGRLDELWSRGELRTWRLRLGSSFCLGDARQKACDPVRSVVWRVGPDTRLLRTEFEGGRQEDVPACQLSSHVPGFGLQAWLRRVPTAERQVFPLDLYGRAQCRGEAVALDGDAVLRRSFLHFDSRGALYLTQLPTQGAQPELLVQDAERVEAAGAAAVAPGQAAATLTVFRLRSSSPLEHPLRQGRWPQAYVKAETGRSRLQPVEVVKLESPQQGVVRLLAAAPVVAEVPAAWTCREYSVVNLLGARERARLPSLQPEAPLPDLRVPFVARLDQLGALGAALELRRGQGEPSYWDAHGCARHLRARLGVLGAAGGIDDVQGAQVLGLGSDGNGLLLMSAAELGVPGRALALLLAGVALLRGVQRWRMAADGALAPMVVSVLAVVDVALLLRLLVALQEVAVRPQGEDTLVAVLLALSLLPLALEAGVWGAWRLRGWLVGLDWRKWLGWGALAGLWLHMVLVLMGFRETAYGLRMTVFVIPCYVLAWGLLLAPPRGDMGARGRVARRLGLLAGVVLAPVAFVLAHDAGALITIAGALVALSLVAPTRLGGPLRWWRGGRVGLYVLFVLLGTVLSVGVLSYGGGHGVDLAGIVALHPRPWLLMAALLLVALLAWRCWHTPARAALGYLGMGVLLVLVAVSSARFDMAPVDCSDGPEARVAGCLQRHELDTNQIRLAYLIYPTLGRNSLSDEARGANFVFDELRWLTTDFAHRGFMSVAPRIGLDRHDNAIASHLIGPFGRPAAWLLVLLLALPAVFFVLQPRMRALAQRAPVSWLAWGCYAFSSAYMVLGNLLVVPFTGRNVYLTNPFSTSDLLDGTLLLLLVLWPLAVEGEDLERQEAS